VDTTGVLSLICIRKFKKTSLGVDILKINKPERSCAKKLEYSKQEADSIMTDYAKGQWKP